MDTQQVSNPELRAHLVPDSCIDPSLLGLEYFAPDAPSYAHVQNGVRDGESSGNAASTQLYDALPHPSSTNVEQPCTHKPRDDHLGGGVDSNLFPINATPPAALTSIQNGGIPVAITPYYHSYSGDYLAYRPIGPYTHPASTAASTSGSDPASNPNPARRPSYEFFLAGLARGGLYNPPGSSAFAQWLPCPTYAHPSPSGSSTSTPSHYSSSVASSSSSTPVTTPEPDESQMSASTGPVRHTRRSARNAVAAAPHPYLQPPFPATPTTTAHEHHPYPCPIVGTLTTRQVEAFIEQASDEAEATAPDRVKCLWDAGSCGDYVSLKRFDGFTEHLRKKHGVPKTGKKVSCRWGEMGCGRPVKSEGLRKHVRSALHLNIPVKCPTCKRTFQRTDVLRRHLMND
ncbi:hypothetical protein R3P38DRAFT_1293676 [Favolaschia claudopus]|uniref:C2H2-type domain-containing protein n=1 Tax=Favolaschia claudopus TaxID=2862362 RepID=A0AAW0AXR7_9AGAR